MIPLVTRTPMSMGFSQRRETGARWTTEWGKQDLALSLLEPKWLRAQLSSVGVCMVKPEVRAPPQVEDAKTSTVLTPTAWPLARVTEGQVSGRFACQLHDR